MKMMTTITVENVRYEPNKNITQTQEIIRINSRLLQNWIVCARNVLWGMKFRMWIIWFCWREKCQWKAFEMLCLCRAPHIFIVCFRWYLVCALNRCVWFIGVCGWVLVSVFVYVRVLLAKAWHQPLEMKVRQIVRLCTFHLHLYWLLGVFVCVSGWAQSYFNIDCSIVGIWKYHPCLWLCYG